MLADRLMGASPACGSLSADVHPAATSLGRILDFVAEELPRWRNDPDRPPRESEPFLNSYLCRHLNRAARRKLDLIHFQPEAPDEATSSRFIDISVVPCSSTPVYCEGRGYTIYDVLMPIECKRLPTPRVPGRDEREYVITAEKARGGIQRFKVGKHGADHDVGAMIGYIQDGDPVLWLVEVNTWLAQAAEVDSSWVGEELTIDSNTEVCRLVSTHRREGRREIRLHHLWVMMA